MNVRVGVKRSVGDPGSSVFFVSLEDDLMRLFASDRLANWMDKMVS